MAKYVLHVEKVDQAEVPSRQFVQVWNCAFEKPVFTSVDKRRLIDTLRMSGAEKVVEIEV